MCDQKSNFFKYPNIHGLSQFNKTILPFVLVGYKLKSAKSKVCASGLVGTVKPLTYPPSVTRRSRGFTWAILGAVSEKRFAGNVTLYKYGHAIS